MATYQTSTGERLEKSTIDYRVREAKKAVLKEQLFEFGYNFCVDCDRNASSGIPIDCAHTISVKECQESGRSELAYDKENIKPRCRTCHNKIDLNDTMWNHAD